MKKTALVLIFISLTKLGISQINDSELSESLRDQISQINNSELFLQFLISHSATYKDFDSLYSIIEGSNCPKNFTYNLINGDSSKKVKVSNVLLYLIGRNFIRPPFDTDHARIKSVNDLMQTLNGDLKDPFTHWSQSYNKISGELKNKVLFKIDSIEIESALLNTENKQYLFLKNNVQSWGKTFNPREKDLLKIEKNDDLPKKNGLIIYYIKQNSVWENRFWNQIKNQDEEFLKNDFGGSLIAENISSYISAQVFNDIVFVELNSKLIWIDVSP